MFRLLKGRWLAVSLATTTLVACGPSTETVAKSSTLHVLDDGEAYGVAYDARGRGAYVSRRDGNTNMKVCAEPSPDVAANVSAEASRQIGLQVQATYEALEAALRASGQGQQQVVSEVVSVAQRTELVLVLRSALYRICEMNFNGVIDKGQTKAAFDAVLHTIRVLGQRDNVAALIAILGNPKLKLSDKERTQVLQAVLRLAYAETLSRPGLPPEVSAMLQTSLRDFTTEGPANPGGPPPGGGGGGASGGGDGGGSQ